MDNGFLCVSAPEETVLFGPCMNNCLILEPLFYFHVVNGHGAQSYANQRTETVQTLSEDQNSRLVKHSCSIHREDIRSFLKLKVTPQNN